MQIFLQSRWEEIILFFKGTDWAWWTAQLCLRGSVGILTLTAAVSANHCPLYRNQEISHCDTAGVFGNVFVLFQPPAVPPANARYIAINKIFIAISRETP